MAAAAAGASNLGAPTSDVGVKMLELLMLRERARAAAAIQGVKPPLQASSLGYDAAQFQRDVQVANQQKTLDPEIADLADHFSIEDSLANALDKAMQTRTDTYEADLQTLWEDLERSRNPSAELQQRIRELSSNTFVTRTKTQENILKFCKKYQLDQTATKHLLDALAVREREHETDTERDLDKLSIHMEHSNAPSKLISMKLKEIRSGSNLGAVWHCCGDSRKRGKDRARDKEPPIDGGPGIEGIRGREARKPGTYKSYTDRELSQRFGEDAQQSSGLMTEEQAMNFQNDMKRKNEEEERRRRSRSARRSRSHKSERRRSRSRSRSRSRGKRRRRDSEDQDDEARGRRDSGRDRARDGGRNGKDSRSRGRQRKQR